MADYIIHKAVTPDKVKKKLQRTTEEYERDYLCQDKLDGCCAVMVLRCDADPVVMSRTGEVYVSLNPVAREFMYRYRREIIEFGGIVLLGEAWHPCLYFNEISGHFRRGKETGELLFMVVDCLTLAEFNAGHSPVGYSERIARLTSDGADADIIASYEPGTYRVSEKLAEALALGHRDGIILRDPNGTWTAGRGTTGEIVKVKQVLSFDLEVVDWEMGKGKHQHRMGALVVNFGGKLLSVGTGFTDEFRENVADNSNGIIGLIAEVEAMDYSSDGLLREPRFKGIRYDKLEPDTIAA